MSVDTAIKKVGVNNGSGADAVNIQDGGNTITVDGTIALGAGSAVVGHVIADSGSTTAVTGDVTVIQGTGTNLHTVIDSGTITTVTTLTGTTALTPGTGASNLGKAEDQASADGDVGVALLAVRKATPADTSGTDGDYEFLQMKSGRLWTSTIVSSALPAGSNSIGEVTVNNSSGASAVNIQDGGNSITVDGTVTIGTSVTPGTSATNLGKAEDGGHSSGDVGVMALAVRQSANAPLSGSDLDYEPLQTDANGHLKVNIIDALPAGTNAIGKLSSNSGVTIGDIGTVSTVTTVTTLTGTTTLTPGTGASNLGKAEDAVHGTGDTGVFCLGVANEAQSSLAADGDYIGRSTDTKGNTLTVGNIAHDGVDAGYPLKVGHKAIAHGTNPTAVAANDRTDSYANRAGIPFIIAGHPNIVTLEAAYTSAQTDTAIVSVSAGTKIIVTAIDATCDNANTVNVSLRVGFGTANTPTTTGVVLTHPGIAPGSGVVRGAGSGILGIGADAEDLRITCSAPTTGSIRVLVTYYTIES